LSALWTVPVGVRKDHLFFAAGFFAAGFLVHLRIFPVSMRFLDFDPFPSLLIAFSFYKVKPVSPVFNIYQIKKKSNVLSRLFCPHSSILFGPAVNRVSLVTQQ